MGKLFTPAVTALLLLVTACNTAKPGAIPFERTGAVSFIASDEPGTIVVRSEGVGAEAGEAIYYAERNALENILFKGIPGSNQRQPVIEKETETLSKFSSYFDELIVKAGYKRFLMDSSSAGSQKIKDGVQITQVVKFDLGNLRKELEQKNIIRKFGI